MCIIVAIPQGESVDKETLQRCWLKNTDGAGFVYHNNRKGLVVHKELFSFDRFYKSLAQSIRDNANKSFLVHFRVATHGVINEANIHPFMVNNELAFAHNGIISAAPVTPNYSDTYMFNKNILKRLPKGFLSNDLFVNLLRGYIGYGSKVVFLDNKNKFTFLNESLGIWDKGVWFSNSGYKDVIIQQSYFNAISSTPYAAQDWGGYNGRGGTGFNDADWMGYSKLYKKTYYDASNCDYCRERLVLDIEIERTCCNRCYRELTTSVPF